MQSLGKRAQVTPLGLLGVGSLTELPKGLAKSEGSLFLYESYGGPPVQVPYVELARDIVAAVDFFRERGVGRGTRVVFPFETNVAVITSFLALTAMGAIPLSVRSLASRAAAEEFLDFLGRLSKVFEPAFILDAPCLKDLETAVPKLALPPKADKARSIDLTASIEAPASDDTAFVQFSSGSTAFPKGVTITHGNLYKNLYYIRQFVEANAGPVRVSHCSSAWLPLYHDMGLIGGLLSPLWNGLSVHLAPPHAFLVQPLEWLTHLTQTKTSYSAIPHFAVPYLLRQIAETDAAERSEWDLSALGLVFNGSEPIRGADLVALGDALAPAGFKPKMLQPSYGMAEAVLLVTCSLHAEPRQVTLENGQTCVGVGAPHADFDLRIVDERGEPCAERALGEILIRGGSIAPGYFLDTVPLLDARGYYHTGDIGFVLDGELFVTGRMSDRIKINGQSFFAPDFEAATERLPFVGPGRAVAFQTDGGVYVLVATPSGTRADDRRQAVRQTLLKSLGVTLPNEHIRFVRPSAIKKTSSGKLRRNEIRLDFCNGSLVSQ